MLRCLCIKAAINERQHAHLKLQLEHEAKLANEQASKTIISVNRSVARRGLTGSSLHTDQIAEAIVGEAVSFAKLCFERAYSIAPDIGAHALAKDHANIFADRWTPKSGTSGWPGIPALKAQGHIGDDIARRKTEALRQELSRIYELEAFRFAQPQLEPEKASTGLKSNKGGRPRAMFWDDMWAGIAAALYNGELKPKSQADVEKAMIEAIEARGYTAAVSTVRARARRLWALISMDDS